METRRVTTRAQNNIFKPNPRFFVCTRRIPPTAIELASISQALKQPQMENSHV